MSRTIALAAAVQFTVMLDFALLLPLGPDLCAPLAIPTAALGSMVAVYTAFAALAGVLAARVLDRFTRRSAMWPLLLGLALAAVLAASAPSFAVLLGGRALAGLCSAPLHALILAMIADEVADGRHGRALGTVLSANALAAVLGVPACLWLADHVSWRLAFVVVAFVAMLVAVLVVASAGSSRAREHAAAQVCAPSQQQRALQRRAHLLVVLAFASAFALTPNLSAYVQFTLGYPREQLPQLYMIAGCGAFVAMHASGRAVDRWGAAWVGSVMLIVLAVTIALLLAVAPPRLGVEPGFVVLLVCLGGRNVALRSLTTRVPEPEQRGRFMAGQASAQQLGAIVGVVLALMLLHTADDGALLGMQALAGCSIALTLVVVPGYFMLERSLRGTSARSSC